MPVRSISYEASAASPVDAQLLQLFFTLLGIDEMTLTTTSATTTLVQHVSNKFLGPLADRRATSLTGSIRLLLSGTEMELTAEMSSWLYAVEESVLAIVRQEKQKEPSFQAALSEFVKHLEQYLIGKKSGGTTTVLVGDAWSAADIVVAVSLAATGIKLESKTLQWMEATLARLDTECGVKVTIAAPPPPAATKTSPSSNPILALLEQHGVPYEAYDHEACTTAEELVEKVPLPDAHHHTHTKNLFLRDKKHGLFLVTTATANAVNTKTLGKALGLKGKVNLRMAEPELLLQVLQAKPGCVGPLSIGVATTTEEQPVTLVLDEALKTFEKIHSHPLTNDKSVQLTPAALDTFLAACKVEPVWLEFAPAGAAPAAAPKAAAGAAPSGGSDAVVKKGTKKKGETLLALQWKKSENFASWYSDVITLSEMIAYYNISGCYILRPWSYKMWELIQEWFNVEIGKMGVENAYFPMFVSKDRLETEKDHVEGFAPEVAWVTKSGDGDLAVPIAVRPTSETIMYPAYSDWIKSHRDLPLKLNQWSNVVRWEFKNPTPFLRTREFLWQEGHTAHSTDKEAEEMVMKALGLYKSVYEELLAVPVIPGYKTEKEKFAGGYRTTTVEAYVAGSGRAIQGATSHHLGQNFGKMFNIQFQDERGETQTAWQTSWGLTTRTIGVMVMVHGDDVGLVLPPRVAPLQVVIIPIVSKKFSREQAAEHCEKIFKDLCEQKIRAKIDDRDSYNPGWKYNHWEQKGVPVRIEVGPRDVEQDSARCVFRYNGEKNDYSVTGLGQLMSDKLVEIQAAMFSKAASDRDSHVVQVTDWVEFVPNLEKHNLILTPWIGGEHQDWEEWVKTKSREEALERMGLAAEEEKTATSVAAKTLCIPFDQPELPDGTLCIASGKPATCWVLWGRSY